MKSKNKQTPSSYEKAKKRVEDIKGFYGHLAIYLLVNLVLVLARNDFRFYLINTSSLEDEGFLSWINWNVFGTAIIWGVFLAFHAIKVFGNNPFLGKSWEERQIQKYLKEEQSASEKYQ
jgi:hypothetical protein